MAKRLAKANLTTANTAVDGTGTIVDLVVGAAGGTRVDSITIKATTDTTAGMIRFFTYSGATWSLLHEEPVTIVDGNAFTPFFTASVRLSAIYLGSAQKLGITTQVSESFTVTAMVDDL